MSVIVGVISFVFFVIAIAIAIMTAILIIGVIVSVVVGLIVGAIVKAVVSVTFRSADRLDLFVSYMVVGIVSPALAPDFRCFGSLTMRRPSS